MILLGGYWYGFWWVLIIHLQLDIFLWDSDLVGESGARVLPGRNCTLYMGPSI